MRNQYSSGEKEHASFIFSVRENPRVPGRIFILIGLERQLSIRRLNNISPRHSQSPRLSLEVIKIIIKSKKTRIDRRRPKRAGDGKIRLLPKWKACKTREARVQLAAYDTPFEGLYLYDERFVFYRIPDSSVRRCLK